MILIIIWAIGFIFWAALQWYYFAKYENYNPKLSGEVRAAILEGLAWPYFAFWGIALLIGIFILFIIELYGQTKEIIAQRRCVSLTKNRKWRRNKYL